VPQHILRVTPGGQPLDLARSSFWNGLKLTV
jgi:hypothetical protein